MASLTGNSINTSYQGLLKTDGNASIPTTATPITDGTGVKSGLEIGNNSGVYQTIIKSDDLYTNGFSVDGTGTNFGGAVDFSAASVSGLPASPAPTDAYNSTAAIKLGITTFVRCPQLAPNYQQSSQQVTVDRVSIMMQTFNAGDTLNKITLVNKTAVAGALCDIAIYDSTFDGSGNIIPNDLIATLGTIDCSTTGLKAISSIGLTIPSSANQIFWFALHPNLNVSLGGGDFNSVILEQQYGDIASAGSGIISKIGMNDYYKAYSAGFDSNISSKTWSNPARFVFVGIG